MKIRRILIKTSVIDKMFRRTYKGRTPGYRIRKWDRETFREAITGKRRKI